MSGEIIAATRDLYEAYRTTMTDPRSAELAARSPEQARMAAKGEQGGTVAVIPVHGFLEQRRSLYGKIFGSTPVDDLGRLFRQMVDEDRVKAVVLHFDSGGGSTFGIAELAATIRTSRGQKPIVAQVDSMACSAAYWLASQADEVICTPGGLVGSVGVFLTHADLSEADRKAGLKVETIAAPAGKASAVPGSPLSDGARASLQRIVDATYGQFIRDIAAGRGCSTGKVEADFGQGHLVTAGDALRRGMVDSLATLDQTLRRLASTSGRDAVLHARDDGAAQRAMIRAQATVAGLHLVSDNGEAQRAAIRRAAGL